MRPRADDDEGYHRNAALGLGRAGNFRQLARRHAVRPLPADKA